MNVLITSIGQRGYLVEHFKESGKGEVEVFAADATKYAPALQNADKAFLIPMAKDENYFSELLKICKQNDIDGIISINDLELPILAKYKEDLKKNGITAVISDETVVDICFDKYKTYLFGKENEIAVPYTYLWNEKERLLDDIKIGKMTYPLIAKPRKGSRSVGIHLVINEEQLLEDIEFLKKQDIPEDEKLMFQEYIDSNQYSVHVFNNNEYDPVSIVGMVNVFNHFGETFHIKTIYDEELIDLGRSIGKKLKHIGPLSADVHRRENGEFVVLEFNPRISGCYSLSQYAGADFPGKIYKLIRNEKIEIENPSNYKMGLVMLKQFTTAFYTEQELDSKLENCE